MECRWLAIKSRNKQGYKILGPHQYFINRNTPRGEDAELYERKPYEGRKEFLFKDIIAEGETETKVKKLANSAIKRERNK